MLLVGSIGRLLPSSHEVKPLSFLHIGVLYYFITVAL